MSERVVSEWLLSAQSLKMNRFTFYYDRFWQDDNLIYVIMIHNMCICVGTVTLWERESERNVAHSSKTVNRFGFRHRNYSTWDSVSNVNFTSHTSLFVQPNNISIFYSTTSNISTGKIYQFIAWNWPFNTHDNQQNIQTIWKRLSFFAFFCLSCKKSYFISRSVSRQRRKKDSQQSKIKVAVTQNKNMTSVSFLDMIKEINAF